MSYTHQQPVDPNFPPLAPAPAKGKNWFARHKVLTGVGAFVIVVAIAAAAGSGGGDSQTALQAGSNTNTTTSDSKADTPAKSETKTETVEGLQADGKSWIYGDWKISDVKVSSADGIGWFSIKADVKYLGEDTSGGDKCFNLALDKGSRQVTSALGCVTSLQPGKTAVLEFPSTDDYVAGPYEITISKTW